MFGRIGCTGPEHFVGDFLVTVFTALQHLGKQGLEGPGFVRLFMIGKAVPEYEIRHPFRVPGGKHDGRQPTGDVVEAEKFNCIPVSMRCKGRLRQLFNFYGRLQTLDRLVRIEQVKLSNDPGYGGQVSMETKAVIYYRAGMRQG